MGIIFEVKDTTESIIKRELVNDLNGNFFKTANKFIRRGFSLSLRDYYEYNIIIGEYEGFPFIIRDGTCIWHVPVDEVTIKDFITTHGLYDGDTITINEAGIGIGDPHFYVFELVSWVIILWPIIVNIKDVYDIAKVIKSIYHRLIGKDKKIVLPFEMLELLRTRDDWTMSDIKKVTSFNDERVIELLLIQGDFRKEGNKYIRNNTHSEEYALSDYTEFVTREAEKCWGEYEKYEDDDVMRDIFQSVHNLNCALTNLLLQSEFHKAGYFEFMMKIIDAFIEEWDELIYKGKCLQFIDVKEDARSYISDEPYVYSIFDQEISTLIKYTNLLCEKFEYPDRII